jgi:pimeloyl-ACP methyl ester carboxylesterase
MGNMRASDFSLQTRTGRFTGLAWPNPGAPKMMCLHGWLDNAASILPLSAYLSGFDLVALDFAGHGHSDHRPAGSRYHMVDNLWDLDAVLDELQWPGCDLVGHSLGGVVASSYAAAAPERVSRLVTLDGLGALSARPQDTAKRLKASLASIRKASGELKDYPDIDTAAKTRQHASGLPFEVARILCERSMSRHGDVYRWCTDPSLNWHSPSLMTEAQVLNILAAIEAPTLSIICNQSREWIDADTMEKRLQTVQNCTQRTVDGHHHFHMDQPELTARHILEFLNSPEPEHAQ